MLSIEVYFGFDINKSDNIHNFLLIFQSTFENNFRYFLIIKIYNEQHFFNFEIVNNFVEKKFNNYIERIVKLDLQRKQKNNSIYIRVNNNKISQNNFHSLIDLFKAIVDL